jgi:hypothetical protein
MLETERGSTISHLLQKKLRRVLRQTTERMIYILVFNRSWVDTRWQQYITYLHTNNTHNTEKGKLGSAGSAPSLQIIPWHLPYNWGESTQKPQLGYNEHPVAKCRFCSLSFQDRWHTCLPQRFGRSRSAAFVSCDENVAPNLVFINFHIPFVSLHLHRTQHSTLQHLAPANHLPTSVVIRHLPEVIAPIY